MRKLLIFPVILLVIFNSYFYSLAFFADEQNPQKESPELTRKPKEELPLEDKRIREPREKPELEKREKAAPELKEWWQWPEPEEEEEKE